MPRLRLRDRSLRVAVAHEWVSARAGSERVFEAFGRLLPTADLHALTWTPGVSMDTDGRQVRTSVLDRPAAREHRAATLPLMPLAWRLAGRSQDYDVVITSSHAAVKGFWPGRSALHLSYTHSPMRYVWLPELDDRGSGSPVHSLARAAGRAWDRRASRWVDSFAANSTEVAGRIDRFYERPARVIHPPVAVDRPSTAASSAPRRGALVLSRWIPYKRIDLAIEACVLVGMPVTVAGSGPQRHVVEELAQRHPGLVDVVHAPSDQQVRDLMARARFLVFPAHEDFGIVPVEAQAAGTPVVGLDAGGTRDTVIDGVTGALAASQTAQSFADAIERLPAPAASVEACRTNARRFTPDQFATGIASWLTDLGVPCDVEHAH